jgi:hypothetical protein
MTAVDGDGQQIELAEIASRASARRSRPPALLVTLPGTGPSAGPATLALNRPGDPLQLPALAAGGGFRRLRALS